jgi:hypothetical protein
MGITTWLWGVVIVILSGWGLRDLVQAAYPRGGPTARQERLWRGLSRIFLALALFAYSGGRVPAALLLGATGLGFAAAWLVSVYRQSLHNTTM